MIASTTYQGHAWIPDGWPQQIWTEGQIPAGGASTMTEVNFEAYRAARLPACLAAEASNIAAQASARAATIQAYLAARSAEFQALSDGIAALNSQIANFPTTPTAAQLRTGLVTVATDVAAVATILANLRPMLAALAQDYIERNTP